MAQGLAGHRSAGGGQLYCVLLILYILLVVVVAFSLSFLYN